MSDIIISIICFAFLGAMAYLDIKFAKSFARRFEEDETDGDISLLDDSNNGN